MMLPERDIMEQIAPYARTYSIQELQEKGREFLQPHCMLDQAGANLKRAFTRALSRLREFRALGNLW